MRLSSVLARGLAGGFPLYISGGMDTLAGKLRKDGDTAATVFDHGVAYLENVAHITSFAATLYHKGEHLLLGGHSFGALAALKVAANLKELDIPVELLVAFDTVKWDNAVPSNVKNAISFYQVGDPVGGGELIPGPGFKGTIEKHRRDMAHAVIDDYPPFHSIVVQRAKLLRAA